MTDEHARGEATEKEFDALIRRRHDARVADEGHRPSEEMWAESERRHAAKRNQDRVAAWYGYLMDSADRTERVAAQIAAEKRARAARLLGVDGLEEIGGGVT